ncbi:hypothetical protein BJ166DRAFT_621905 [Pestalotiopsis sp. NC0098]|nr:hypothetical protein BJ166DRAFT_621905 [Pestalotiopsis sp. NC0098]
MTRFALGRLEDEEWAKWRSFRNRHRSCPIYQFYDLAGLEADRLDKESTDIVEEEPISDDEDEWDGIDIDPVLRRARLRIKRVWQELGIWGPHFEHLITGGADSNTESSSWVLPPEHESRVEVFHRSRPINIFRHQVLNAGKMLLDEMPTKRGRYAAGDFSDIKPVAYRLVRNQWEERGIWLDCWGELPGNLWGHEIPTEQWYSGTDPREKQFQCLPRAEGKRNIMTSYRRRLRKIQRRVRWAATGDDLDADCQNEDDTSSSTDSCECLVTRVSNLSWKLHVDTMQRQERLAFQVSRAVLVAEESEMQTRQGLPALDSELEKLPEPVMEREVKSLIEDVAKDHQIPMCLGSDCVVHDSGLEDRVAETFSNARMPGIFPGDLEQYIDSW